MRENWELLQRYTNDGQIVNFQGAEREMRQITITFKQDDKQVVTCTVDFGNRDEASESENKLADASQTLIATALKKLPADLLGEGHGSTEQKAAQLARGDAAPPLSRYGLSLKERVPGL